MLYKYLCVIIFCISGYFLWVKHHNLHSNHPKTEISSVINLVESTGIIRELIYKNALESVLEEHDPEQLSLLLNNISPASMAFESEVLSTTVPLVVVCYYNPNDEKHTLLLEQLESLAFTYIDKVKFVIIDTEQLFSLAQKAEIEKTPTFLIFKERKVIDEYEDIDELKNILTSHTLTI